MRNRIGVLCVLVLALCSWPAMAGEGEQMSEKEMMEMMQKLGAPGDMHKKLDVFVGTWNTSATFWMEPDGAPMKSAGTSVNKWILDGRYVHQTYTGDFMGQPFTGIGNTGYDNVRKEYFSTWQDSTSTQLSLMKGSGDGTTFVMKGQMDDPMSGQTMDMVERITVKDHDTHLLEMFIVMPDGSDFKNMEIVYSRAK